ncbi:MAG: Dihydrouridine synthase DuS [Parcubacteria group bacterium GW2011_GWD2_38_12]|nr:MAG: Dihydrouridine synthase DuS [Parcubacteria group bacterium GW2011_GWC2_36_17]KKQ39913.1 MAG: Dihydrouridine synthase DuS [Candidatus Moranbacteria bacterium GW2011_GWF2_37_7]KKQ41838.1 MAG: Dihydrouridine synthase DuS [Parcubacteria group bacterium GW2011_GWE2_37_8]KKQ52290.1 MAG: Dihydrouridine synthase DuS [Parcubacteria group bacterium GW2011_GWD2_38_12]KKQ57936.1 MAG: Dihydrouridine synthase DuS [Parcubacteria group bacterium GW2011_GWD1_38_16]
MDNFWQKLKKPIIGMAPMDGVTDAAFRRIICEYAKPDVIFTEFVPVDGICAGARVLTEGLIYGANERPIVAQIFGANPKNFYKIAPFLCELGFDGIDINMGCPDKAIMKQGGGASLIANPKLAKEVVINLKQGISDWAKGKKIEDFGLPQNIVEYAMDSMLRLGGERETIPVSVKTRIGVDNNSLQQAKDWAKHLTEMGLANISIHGRTLKQMYFGVANWETIAEMAKIIRDTDAKITILGNGDIKNITEAKEKALKYGLDGALVGRAVMGNPWIFSGKETSAKEKLTVAIEHAKYYEMIFTERPFINMRKHLAWYCRGFEGASEVRAQLMKINNARECEEVIMEVIVKL